MKFHDILRKNQGSLSINSIRNCSKVLTDLNLECVMESEVRKRIFGTPWWAGIELTLVWYYKRLKMYIPLCHGDQQRFAQKRVNEQVPGFLFAYGSIFFITIQCQIGCIWIMIDRVLWFCFLSGVAVLHEAVIWDGQEAAVYGHSVISGDLLKNLFCFFLTVIGS